MALGSVNVAGMTQEDLDAVTAIVQIVLDRIGATADTGGSVEDGTLMAKDNRLIADLAEHMGIWTAARAGHIDTIKSDAAAAKADAAAAKSNTATNNTASSTGTLSQKISYIINQMANGSVKMGAVKSVQRGTGTTPLSSTNNILDIPINSVNPDKCIVMFKMHDPTLGYFKLVSLSETNMRFSGHGLYEPKKNYVYEWQIIEFY